MLKRDLTRRREMFALIIVAIVITGSPLAGSKFAFAGGGACALVPNEHDPNLKVLQCGQDQTPQVRRRRVAVQQHDGRPGARLDVGHLATKDTGETLGRSPLCWGHDGQPRAQAAARSRRRRTT